MRDCEGIISNCVCETIRKLLPVKHILKEYLGDDVEDETEDISKLNSNNLKMLVQYTFPLHVQTQFRIQRKFSR